MKIRQRIALAVLSASVFTLAGTPRTGGAQAHPLPRIAFPAVLRHTMSRHHATIRPEWVVRAHAPVAPSLADQ